MIAVGHDSRIDDRRALRLSRVFRAGYLQNDALLATCYNAAEATLLTSLADNSPNVMYESLACGVPVVAYRVGGIPDAVLHMETGLLAAAGDADGLAAALVQVLDDDALRARLGAGARALMLRAFSLESPGPAVLVAVLAPGRRPQRRRLRDCRMSASVNAHPSFFEAVPVEMHGHRKKLEFFAASLQRLAAERGLRPADIAILEVGCSNGRNVALPLAELGYDVTGLDVHEPSIAAANAANRMPNARFLTTELSALDTRSADTPW